MNPTRRRGFTLVEILIVVVIMGILAAIVVPHFGSTSDDARFTSVLANIQDLRQSIDLYRNQHLGLLPGVVDTFPDTVFAEQLTLPTNVRGDRSAAANQGFGDPNYPLGPYVNNVLPPNPYNGSRKVRTVSSFPAAAPGGGSVSDPGWVYEITSGRIRVNQAGTAPNGQTYWEL